MKSSQDAAGINSPNSPNGAPNSTKGLDATHGGARLVLPAIDAAALRKQGVDTTHVDTTRVDTLPMAWFELTISGSDMTDMDFKYPLATNGGTTIDIQSIPAGKGRNFHGRLFNGNGRLLYEGVTLADIRGGEYADVRLFLTKASGSANVCVVIEGQPVPACAMDSLPPPPPPTSNLASHCWYVTSDSVNGLLHLYDQPVNGFAGYLMTLDMHSLPVTTWAYNLDTLSVIVIRPSMDKKWRLSGVVQNGMYWTGSVSGAPMESPFSFYGKPGACPQGTVVVIPIDTVPVPVPPIDTLSIPVDTLLPPKDSLKAGGIPGMNSSRGETTACFEIRLDYASGCEIDGFAKMTFVAGNIVKGYITIADHPSRSYSQILGSYDQNAIHIESVLPGFGVPTADSIMYDGAISMDRTMAKGNYLRLPAEKKGIWMMSSMVCGNWTLKNPDSSCVTSKQVLPGK